MNKITKINSEDFSAILYGGEIRKAGTEHNYKSAVFFDNDISIDSNNTNSYGEINSNSFYSNNLSISLWICPMNESSNNSRVILNDNLNKFTGIVFNSNGDPGSLGIVWNASPSSSPLKLPIVLKNDIWSHIVVILKNLVT